MGKEDSNPAPESGNFKQDILEAPKGPSWFRKLREHIPVKQLLLTGIAIGVAYVGVNWGSQIVESIIQDPKEAMWRVGIFAAMGTLASALLADMAGG